MLMQYESQVTKDVNLHYMKYCTLRLSRFLFSIWIHDLKKIIDCILPVSVNRQNTGSGAFYGQKSIKCIILPFIKSAWYIKPI